MNARFAVAAIAGISIALGLFLLMHTLISGNSNLDKDRDTALRLDFIQVKQDELQNIRERKPPPKPEPPKKPPPPPKLTVTNPERPPPDMPPLEAPRVSVPVSTGSGPYLGGWSPGDPAAEGDVIPIVRIEPQFPREALINGISGWVEIEFTINPDGSVADPKVLKSEPRRLFDRNAIRAIFKWKFKPRIVDGKPVARRATQKLEFTLDK